MSQEKLQKEILELSDADTWPVARTEWGLHNIRLSEDETCLCGHHPISEICMIENEVNGNWAEVGNRCINRFGGIDSERVFSSVRKVKKQLKASFNEPAILLMYKRGVITDWERKFYLDIWRKRKLSDRQSAIKREINRKVLEYARRKGEPLVRRATNLNTTESVVAKRRDSPACAVSV